MKADFDPSHWCPADVPTNPRIDPRNVPPDVHLRRRLAGTLTAASGSSAGFAVPEKAQSEAALTYAQTRPGFKNGFWRRRIRASQRLLDQIWAKMMIAVACE